MDKTEGRKKSKSSKKKESSRETNGLAMRIRSTNSEKEAEALVKTKNITLLRQEIVWYHQKNKHMVSRGEGSVTLHGGSNRHLVALLPGGRRRRYHLGTRRSPSLPLHRPSRRSARTYPARGRHPRPRQPARHRARRRRPRPRRRRRKLRQRRPALPRCTMWRSRRAVSAQNKKEGISTTRAKTLTYTHEESFSHTVS